MIAEKIDTWKIQLTIVINFISSKDNDKECPMHSTSDNIETMINLKADEVIEELFQSLLSRHQIGLEASVNSSYFVFDFVHLLHCKCHKINLSCSGSYIDFLNWLKNKKTTLNPK